MSSEGVAKLQKWASDKQLGQVTLSPDGSQLSLNDDTITDTNSQKVTIEYSGKSCEYTLASIFLQIVNPDQSLVGYRKACKQHQVKDFVKALDKPTIVGYFLPESAAAEAVPAPPAAPPAAAASVPDSASAPPDSSATTDAEREKRHREKERSKRHKKEKEKHRRDSKRRHSSSSKPESAIKKKPKMIDNAKLMANLGTVVDKRAAASSLLSTTTTEVSEEKLKARQELHSALSCDGFDVTKDLLQQYRETTSKILAWEIPVGDSASILQAAPGKDLTRILQLYLDSMNPKKSSKTSTATQEQHQQQRSGFRQHLVGQKPIIILPKGMTVPLTLLNAHEFFGNRKFIPRDVMQKRGGKANITTTFSRRVNARLGGGTVEYELMDNPKQRLKSAKDWERVVAVVALGASWQFKDWPGLYSNPVHLFARTFGFYVGMEGDKIPKELQGWAVTQSTLNRDKRGLDSVTYASFWNGLDEFMSIHKPEMLPQDAVL